MAELRFDARPIRPNFPTHTPRPIETSDNNPNQCYQYAWSCSTAVLLRLIFLSNFVHFYVLSQPTQARAEQTKVKQTTELRHTLPTIHTGATHEHQTRRVRVRTTRRKERVGDSLPLLSSYVCWRCSCECGCVRLKAWKSLKYSTVDSAEPNRTEPNRRKRTVTLTTH